METTNLSRPARIRRAQALAQLYRFMYNGGAAFVIVAIFCMGLLLTAPRPPVAPNLYAGSDSVDWSPTGIVTTDYALVHDTAEAGFMQIVTLPWFDSFDTLTPEGYVELEDTPSKDVHMGHPDCWTLAVSQLRYDERVNRWAYVLWNYDYDRSSPHYNRSFLMWEDDLRYIFESYPAYALQYSSY